MVSTVRYHKIAMSLHWLMALLIIGMIALGIFMGDIKPLALRIDVYQFHKSIGITLLFLALIRLGWRFTHPAPALPESMNTLEKTGAHTAHWLLYALMIIMPLSGWLIASTSKYPTLFYLLFEMPHLPLPASIDSKALHEQAEAVHAISTQWVAIPLIIGHFMAGLFHHYIRKDNVLTRMLPWGKK